MFEIWQIKNGNTNLIDAKRSAEDARQVAIEQSRVNDAVYAVVRQGFGVALYYAWRGVLGDPMEIMRRMSAPQGAPVLRLEPAEPEEPTKPRGRRKTGPAETKLTDGKLASYDPIDLDGLK